MTNQDTAALSALCRSSIFPQQPPQQLSVSPLGLLRGTTTATTGAYTPSQGFTGLTGASSNKQLIQLNSGFYVMRNDGTTPAAVDDDTSVTNANTADPHQTTNSYSLPFVYCESSLKYLLAYGRGDLLLLLLSSHSVVSIEALTAIQEAIEPISIELLNGLAQECQVQGGELGHVPGWRYSVQEKTAKSNNSNGKATKSVGSDSGAGGGVRASPRSKVSAMTHHARALATAVTDSLGRLKDAEDAVEICARSTQGVWIVGRQEHRQNHRRSVVVREKRIDGDASQSITIIEQSLQSLDLV